MKKLACLLFALCLMLGVFAGCGSETGTPAETPAQTPAETPEAPAASETPEAPAETPAGTTAEKTQLDLWYYWDGDLQEIMNAYVEEFNSQSETATVTATFVPIGEYNQKVLTAAAGGKVPDILVFGVDSTATLAESGVLGVMTDAVKEGGFEERVLPEVLREHQYNGEYYGLPIYGNCLALFYNTDMIPEAPTTWEALMEVAGEVTTDECYALAVAAPENEEGIFQFLPWLWSAGADLDSVDSEESIEAVREASNA